MNKQITLTFTTNELILLTAIAVLAAALVFMTIQCRSQQERANAYARMLDQTVLVPKAALLPPPTKLGGK